MRITLKNQYNEKERDGSQGGDDRLQELPEWLEEFTYNEKVKNCMHPHTFPRTQIRNVIGIKIEEAQYLYSFSQRPKLRSLLANQNDKSSLQKANLVFRIQPIKVLNLTVEGQIRDLPAQQELSRVRSMSTGLLIQMNTLQTRASH